jgi:hypothetical protein
MCRLEVREQITSGQANLFWQGKRILVEAPPNWDDAWCPVPKIPRISGTRHWSLAQTELRLTILAGNPPLKIGKQTQADSLLFR